MKVKHGYARRCNVSPLYKRWLNMLRRCEDQHCKSFPRYGGRGITVCERWHSFECFLTDMGVPTDGMTIERIDSNASYCPENCRWASQKEQANNRRNNNVIEWNGKRQTLAQWAAETGIHERCLYDRIVRQKWPLERAMTEQIGTQGIGISRRPG